MGSPKIAPLIFVIEPFGGSTRAHLPTLPLLYVDDFAVTRGEGVFETLRVVDGKVVNLERHVRRFQRSAVALGIPEPKASHWSKATADACAEWENLHPGIEATCRWTLSRGRESRRDIPTAWMVISPVSPEILWQREHGVKAMTGPRGYRLTEETPWAVSGVKSLGYAANMSALRYAKSQGFDDVIFCDGENVLEGATSTVLSIRGHKIRTPLTGGDVLPGTTQAALFSQATAAGFSCKEKPLTKSDLLKADSVWLVSSVRGAVRVTQLDDRIITKSGDAFDLDKYLKGIEIPERG
ncbi:aminodeoxychorismate lyase [Corynebacterium epidermidicanis]|uniref:Branched-chain amino acid aminotransferase/4-amino-4-deoxychorismate lyase n=1 Tax=Corynebacterium epidermidicanis TaxID=1050174 RepID=A0A0G3GS17_9CORY|nr:aminodeoxychorismate lyase [Corynebacterium epidermidicanis]AKK03909.1 branched-chain amino acid aminotransferase/4-amino-4-deoxychorismate lyase [Corynebacterium epidermidicanis]